MLISKKAGLACCLREAASSNNRDTLIRTRVATLVAASFYGIFGILDVVMIPEQVYAFWIIRYAVVIPVALAVLAFTFHKSYEKYSQHALFFMILIGGLGIEIMIMLADPPAKYSYYAGIILVVIVLHTAIGMRFPWAMACSFTIVLVYEIIAVWIIDTPFLYLVSSNFFFISSVMLCMLAGYSMELHARHRFFPAICSPLKRKKSRPPTGNWTNGSKREPGNCQRPTSSSRLKWNSAWQPRSSVLNWKLL